MKKAFMMTIALLCAVAQGAWAESVTFNVRSWDATTKQVVTTATTKDCTVLTGSHSDDWLGWPATPTTAKRPNSRPPSLMRRKPRCFRR